MTTGKASMPQTVTVIIFLYYVAFSTFFCTSSSISSAFSRVVYPLLRPFASAFSSPARDSSPPLKSVFP